MSTILALALAAGTVGPPAPVSGRVEGLALVSYEGRVAIRINYTGRPGAASVTRAGNVARVTLARTDLGWRFGSGRHFEWRPANSPVTTMAAAERAIDLLTVEASRGETALVFELPSDVSIDLRQARYALLVVLRVAGAPGALVAQAPAAPVIQVPPPAPMPPAASPTPVPVAPAPAPTPAPAPAALAPPVNTVAQEPTPAAPPVAAPVPAAPASDLYRQLFPPAATPEAVAEMSGDDDTPTLYSRLFESRPPEQGAPPAEELAAVERAPEGEEGFPVGPFRLRPTFGASFVNADASLVDTPGTVNDRYFQFEPGISARARVREGAFTAEYAPSFRSGASFAATQDPTHLLTGSLELPFGSDSLLSVSERFMVSTLDTREVDPGGEYFFDLGRFQRNLLSANARFGLGPRFFAELGGALGHVSFDDERAGFFAYDNRMVSAGLGYELTPNLRASVSYVHDEVPTPDERPEAEASANSALITLQGDLLPLLTGRLSMGYRDQKNPNADLSGQRFQGFTMAGSLTRELSRSASLSLVVNRSTPVSNFEDNGFYVNTSVQGALSTQLPAALTLEAGVGYVWNDYEVPSLEIGVPREDRILGFYGGLRRTISRQWWVSAFYRREQRRSNLDAFDTTSDGFMLQVNWGLFGPRR